MDRNPLDLEWVDVPAATFTMGDDRGLWDQTPAHPVRLSPFRIAADRVTLAQWRRFRPESPAWESDDAVVGVSWHDAVAYCVWLSREAGRPCRLPTEAEWERVRRAGPALGVRGMGGGRLEWCADWYGDYAPGAQTDPIGAAAGFVRVVRGGTLDAADPDPAYQSPAYRAGMPPTFGAAGAVPEAPTVSGAGWVGVWYGSDDFMRPQEADRIVGPDTTWDPVGVRGGDWSAQWRGLLRAPASGEVRIVVETDRRAWLTVDGVEIPSGQPVRLTAGRAHRVALRYTHRGGPAFLRLRWTLPGATTAPIPASALSHDAADRAAMDRLVPASAGRPPGAHAIGFRVVQAPAPASRPTPPVVEFVRQEVSPPGGWVRQGPDPKTPWLRRRPALPTPIETHTDPAYQKAIDAAGFHPSFRGHNHSPALTVCPNGDLLAVWYTSWREYEPEVSLIAARLRFGAEVWDFPSRLIDLPGANDHAPLLWTDRGRVRLFWGSPRFGPGAFPFQEIVSGDSGATWSPVRFPRFVSRIEAHSRQPVNSAFRGRDGALYLASDAVGARSVFWRSSDDGRTWTDPGGRTAGRHTVGAILKNGGLLAMGGKNSEIDGFMPRAVSSDGGKSYRVDRSPFPALGANQRPSLLRLASGRLFFAGDFQSPGGARPPGSADVGSYVALSDDDGRTWTVKKLPGALPHENGPGFFGGLPGATTLGYSVARQSPNGLVHLLTSMTRPSQHFELNEAWILSPTAGETPDPPRGPIAALRAGMRCPLVRAADGRALRHGREKAPHLDGRPRYAATWDRGRKVGRETAWRADGTKAWEWDHRPDGAAVWRTYWEDGRLRSESHWREFRAVGAARRWDRSGKPLPATVFGPAPGG